MQTTPALPPRLGLGELFLRFLRFGCFAWGGPVAQIAMLREELVDRERWVDGARFNRVLGVYQALPGPEATELCIWFGQVSRGRLGGLVAGLAFLLPGLALMLALTWAYVVAGPFDGRALAALAAMQVAAVAIVARGAWKLGSRSLLDRGSVAIAIAAAVATLAGVHFAIVLAAAGVLLELARRWRVPGRGAIALALAGSLALVALHPPTVVPAGGDARGTATNAGSAELHEVAASGLRAGALTFGGAYTVIPFLRHDAVDEGEWLTDAELLQGLAIGSVLPAPLVIFATFVGWLAAGLPGAIAMTIGVFLPAFAITLAGHSTLERIIDDARVHDLLDGVMAGVVGLVAVTAALLAVTLVGSLPLAAVLVAAGVVLWRSGSMLAIPVVMLGAALVGAVLG